MRIWSFLSLCLGLVLASEAFTERRSPIIFAARGYRVDTVANNLRVPWQLVFLPDRSLLFTEREGRVRIIRGNKLLSRPVLNLDDIALKNKSGALGLCLHPDFNKNKWVYLASNYSFENRMKLRIVRYELNKDSLVRPFVILKDLPANQNHTGCRLLFGPDHKLYISTGDADQPVQAQDLKAYNGKILRVNGDGSIPVDNPFYQNDTARKEIWSYGHRNPQGLAFQRGTNLLYESEHGPTGGDEINLIVKGGNYGWPEVHHNLRRVGMESSLQQYTPSIGPGEVMFYYGNQFPQLKGHLLVACLRGESILNLGIAGREISSQLMMFRKQYGRIRSLVTGPDGYLYFSTSMHDPGEGHPRDNHDDMILRIRPSDKMSIGGQELAPGSIVNSEKTDAARLFQQLCAACHGDQLQGTLTAKGFINTKFLQGSDKESIVKSVKNGIPEKGMPAWRGALSHEDIDRLADFIISKTTKQGN